MKTLKKLFEHNMIWYSKKMGVPSDVFWTFFVKQNQLHSKRIC